jgi:hypothetical protein
MKKIVIREGVALYSFFHSVIFRKASGSMNGRILAEQVFVLYAELFKIGNI